MTDNTHRRRGGLATAAKHGTEHMAAIGRRGGLATVARHGTAHMADIGSKGGLVAQGLYFEDYDGWQQRLAESASTRRRTVRGWDDRLEYPQIGGAS